MTNAYDSSRGNPTDRQRRKLWLLETYAANLDVYNGLSPITEIVVDVSGINACRIGDGDPACRCYRCGRLLCATRTGNDLKAQLR